MKSAGWFVIGSLVTIVVIAMVLAGGWLLVRGARATPLFRGWGMMGTAPSAQLGPEQQCSVSGSTWGPGMMGEAWGRGRGAGTWGDGAVCPLSGSSTTGQTGSIEEAVDAFAAYLAGLGYPDLALEEVMEFEENYYAIAVEPDTGTGALELLLDKDTGALGPEPGPNMMWNARYGMHGRGGMMGWAVSEENTLSGDEAVALAQDWLDQQHPGEVTEGHADPFYGYYTIHTLRDGEIAGMLSVHGRTGQIWYHTWHGDFVQMIEPDAS